MDDIYKVLRDCIGFEWDEYNIKKNWEKHNVSPIESEQVFFNFPLLVEADIKHSKLESRYYVLGRTDSNRRLFIVFTIREDKIRVISSRDMNKREREEYEKHD
ncbi:hypothetical protein BVY01_02600 [bacterium I07]|nr:hypothetical protein BVY01_02600 [bacterium I07]